MLGGVEGGGDVDLNGDGGLTTLGCGGGVNLGGEEIAGAFGGDEIKGDFGGPEADMLGGVGRPTFGADGGVAGALGTEAAAGAPAFTTLLPRSLSPNFSNIMLIFSPLFADAS